MINIEKFAERLKIVIHYYELSAASLANKIDVQRSSISHILSGRNKPSLEFVLKILKTFPEVELYWLVNGVGKFPKQTIRKEITPTLFSIEEVDKPKSNMLKPADNSELTIERIVIFYKNSTFKEYIS